MSKRNRIGQAFLLAGGIIMIIHFIYYMRFIVPSIKIFFEVLSFVKNSSLLEYYSKGLNWLKALNLMGLGRIISMLLFSGFFLIVSILSIKWRKREEHWADLKLFPVFLIGFCTRTCFSSFTENLSSAMSSVGVILISVGALLLVIMEQKPEQKWLDKYGAAVTNISAIIMLYLSGLFIGETCNGFNWFFKDDYVMNIYETVFGSTELWIVLKLCYYAFIGLGLLLAGRWHLLNFKGIYQHIQLRFSLAVHLFLVLAVLILNKTRYRTFCIPFPRLILLFLGLLYFIGASLLYFSARRKESYEIQSSLGN